MISAPGFEARIKTVIDFINSELKKKPLQVTIFEVLKGVAHTLGGQISDYIDLQSHIATIFTVSELNTHLLDYLNELNMALLKSKESKSRQHLYAICDKLLSMIYSVLNQRVEKSLSFPRNEISAITNNPVIFNFSENFKAVKKRTLLICWVLACQRHLL